MRLLLIGRIPCATGANCVVIEKCTEATRKKLKILDSDPSYNVSATRTGLAGGGTYHLRSVFFYPFSDVQMHKEGQARLKAGFDYSSFFLLLSFFRGSPTILRTLYLEFVLGYNFSVVTG